MALNDQLANTAAAGPRNASPLAKMDALVAKLASTSLVGLALRFGLAVPYWRSGVNKWDAFAGLDLAPNPLATTVSESGVFALSDVTVLLFTEEFKLHIFGAQLDYPFPALTGAMAGLAEVLLPVLLVLGFFTRFAAVALLAMTIVIQLTVPSGWPLHLAWAAMALALMSVGPGRASVDALLRRG